MSTATEGRAREYRVRKNMVSAGWVPIMRAAGSKGVADLFMGHALHGGALVQVGTGNKVIRCATKDCDHDGGTAAQCARDRFVTAAELCGALALLATATRAGIRYWWVTRDQPRHWAEWSL